MIKLEDYMQIIKSENNVLSEQELNLLSDILIKLDSQINCSNCQIRMGKICRLETECEYSNY